MQLSSLSRVLGGKEALHMNLNSQMDLIELSKKGISKKTLNHLVKYALKI